MKEFFVGQNLEECERFRSTFPNTDWMKKYIGSNYVTRLGDSPECQLESDLYTDIRRCFDGVMRAGPGHILSAQEPNFERVYVFKDGNIADWVDPVLESRGLMIELPSEAFQELCPDFIEHCKAEAFHRRTWWQWKTAKDSVWVEVIPEALVDGMIPKRKLSDILGFFE